MLNSILPCNWEIFISSGNMLEKQTILIQGCLQFALLGDICPFELSAIWLYSNMRPMLCIPFESPSIYSAWVLRYIFLFNPPLYIPLESSRVKVVDIDLKLANQVQPRRYPRFCKCVPIERAVPTKGRIDFVNHFYISKCLHMAKCQNISPG